MADDDDDDGDENEEKRALCFRRDDATSRHIGIEEDSLSLSISQLAKLDEISTLLKCQQ